jgi:hypothetical protein
MEIGKERLLAFEVLKKTVVKCPMMLVELALVMKGQLEFVETVKKMIVGDWKMETKAV